MSDRTPGFCPYCGTGLVDGKCPNCDTPKKPYSKLTYEEKKKVLAADLASGKLARWQYKVEMENLKAEYSGQSPERTTPSMVNRRSVSYRNGGFCAKRQGLLLAASIISLVLILFSVTVQVLSIIRLNEYLEKNPVSSGTSQQEEQTDSSWDSVIYSLGYNLVYPVLGTVISLSGTVFSFLGWKTGKRWMALVAGIVFLANPYGGMMLICSIFCFISYARMT